MSSGMAMAIEIPEAIVTAGTYWVVGANGLAEASGMLVGISIASTKNN
jgi:hypothetical protein